MTVVFASSYHVKNIAAVCDKAINNFNVSFFNNNFGTL